MSFLTGWTKAKAITIPSAYITGSLTNFPLSVQFTNDAQIGAAALANGYDLRFTLADGTAVCSCYRRSFSITGGLASGIYDVLVPSLTSGVNGSLLCQYANASAPDVSNSAAVFGAAGAGFAGAWGFGDGVTLDLTDLSGNGNNGTTGGAGASVGVIGGAAVFDANGDYIDCGNSTSLQLASPRTLSAWIKTNSSASGYHDIFSKDGAYCLNVNAGELVTYDWGGGGKKSSGVNVATNTWRHVVAVLSTATNGSQLYVDGISAGSSWTGGTNNYQILKCTIGNLSNDYPMFPTYTEPYVGLVSEPRISPVARSAAWAYLDFNQVANQSSVVLWGAEQSTTTPSFDIGGRFARRTGAAPNFGGRLVRAH